MDRLSALDAAFIDAEDQDPHVSMAIASIAIFEGPAPSYADLCAHVSNRLPLLPHYQQKLRKIPLRLGPPVWVDDPDFDLSHHVRHTALPAPGGDVELSRLMGRLMAQRLDRDHPLWEDWMVEGLEHDHWAIISRVHHCMVDGVSGTDLYRVVFDSSPEPSDGPTEQRTLAPEPSSLALVVRAARDAVVLPAADARAVATSLAHPRRVLQQTAATLHGLRKLAGTLSPAPPSTLSGQIGQQRRFTWARATLDDVRTVKASLGGTVNDIVLAAITNGFRALLMARGEDLDARMLPTLVPVSLRAPGEEAIYENRVSALIAHLPVHLSDPVERLDAVRSQLSELKASQESAVGGTVISLAEYLPYSVTSLTRVASRVHQREIVTVTTNVPGPRQQLYAFGRRLEEILPYVPIATTVRTGVAIFSYCDRLTFGITGDYDTAPDLQILAQGIESGITDLVKVALQSTTEGPSIAET